MSNKNDFQQRRSSFTKADGLVPAGLILLSAVPFIAGIFRLFTLASGAEITPENARFFASPWPVIIHIIGATLFSILGAFQFSNGFRRRWPNWHRLVGRVLIGCGLAAALSGLWMTHFYPLQPDLQGNILYFARMVLGSMMALFTVFSLIAIRWRNIASHRAWIIRAYAIGQGAGTQVLVLLPYGLLFGTPNELTRDLLMCLAWLINIILAEWIIGGNSIYRSGRAFFASQKLLSRQENMNITK